MKKYSISSSTNKLQLGTLCIDDNNQMSIHFRTNLDPKYVPEFFRGNYLNGFRVFKHKDCIEFFSRYITPRIRLDAKSLFKWGTDDCDILGIFKCLNISKNIQLNIKRIDISEEEFYNNNKALAF